MSTLFIITSRAEQDMVIWLGEVTFLYFKVDSR